MSMSDSSSLSSAPSTDDEAVAKSVNRSIGLQKYFKPKPKPVQKDISPPPPKRPASPPHDYVLADNPDIAFIVMFRSRFSEAFPKSLPHYGPQDIEKGVADITPGDHIERLLCALIGLVLNRKKDVERGHYQRALEEAVQTHASQWPRAWKGKNPLHGGGSFTAMSPDERLTFLKALILWSLSSSEAIQTKIKESYKQARHEDDLNQPLSIQPWGKDAYKRQYWLIEGQDDTHFRLYRETNPSSPKSTWWSVAGTIDELKAFADSLDDQKSQAPRRLSEKIRNAVPRFEGSEEKRKRRDYRLARKAAFTRPLPGFSLYEGRTRGKKQRYVFSDDEDEESSDAVPTRKSARRSGISTPAEPSGPTFTASGRQIRSRVGGIYGESMTNGRDKEQAATAENGNEHSITNGRPQRSNRGRLANGAGNHIEGYNSLDEMDEESDAASSGNEWDGGDDDDANDNGDDDDKMSEDEDDEGLDQPSLVVQLRYPKGKVASSPIPPEGTNDSDSTKIPEPEPLEKERAFPTRPAAPGPTVDSGMEVDQVPEEPPSLPETKAPVDTNGIPKDQHIPSTNEAAS